MKANSVGGHIRCQGQGAGWSLTDNSRTTAKSGVFVVSAMRAFLAVLLVAALLPMASPASAQAAGGTQLLSDPKGDLQVQVVDNAQKLPESRFKSLDLVALSMSEAEETFTLSVQVAGLDQAPEVPGADDAVIAVNLRHNDQEYQAVMIRALGDQSYYFGYLLKYTPEGQGTNFQRELQITADAATGTISTTLTRDELLDKEGAAPFPGRQLDGFWASSFLRSSQGFANINGNDPGRMYNVYDRMPDFSTGTVPFPTKLGLSQSGHAALWSADPIRASNGEQATYVFNLTAQNSGEQAELFQIVATGAPPEWQVTIPDAFVNVGAGQSVHVPILVSTPFAHIHGALKKFRVEMQSQADPGSIGRLDLGVRYFATPQPGGHHNQLYLHSGQFGSANPAFQVFEACCSGNTGFEYFNTLETDPADANVPIGGTFAGYSCGNGCVPDAPRARWEWYVFLQPDLAMGLDFNLAGDGLLNVNVQSPLPLKDAIFGGSLIHLAYDEAKADWVQTTVANFTSGPLDMLPNAPQVFTFPFKPSPAADFLPRAKRAYFGLLLNMTTVKPSLFTGAEAPVLVPGGDLTLPLFEYRDPVQAAFSTAGAVRLETVGEHERMVNPGKTAVFNARLTNDLDTDKTFVVSLSGTNTGWARILGPATFGVAAHASADVHVAVALPASATDREVADLIVTAQAEAQPELHGIVRLLAIPDLGHDHPDESAAAADLGTPIAKKGPMPQAPLLATALLALAAIASRRRALK